MFFKCFYFIFSNDTAEIKLFDFDLNLNLPVPDMYANAGCNKPITLEKEGWGWGAPSSICLSITPAKNTIYARKHDTDVTCNVKNYSASDISVDCGNGVKKPWTNVTC